MAKEVNVLRVSMVCLVLVAVLLLLAVVALGVGSAGYSLQQIIQALFYDESGNIKKQNLETMRQKLVLFKAMGYKNIFSSDAKGTQVSVNNVNQNTLLNNISFEDARNNIENMTALREEEINDIFEKIDEIEKLVLSTERKTKKWEKAKPIIKWIADKGVDAGMLMLQLLLKIG